MDSISKSLVDAIAPEHVCKLAVCIAFDLNEPLKVELKLYCQSSGNSGSGAMVLMAVRRYI